MTQQWKFHIDHKIPLNPKDIHIWDIEFGNCDAIFETYSDLGAPDFIFHWGGVDINIGRAQDEVDWFISELFDLYFWLLGSAPKLDLGFHTQGFIANMAISRTGEIVEVLADWESTYGHGSNILAKKMTLSVEALTHELLTFFKTVEADLLHTGRAWHYLTTIIRAADINASAGKVNIVQLEGVGVSVDKLHVSKYLTEGYEPKDVS